MSKGRGDLKPEDILDLYVDLVRRVGGRSPSLAELDRTENLTRNTVRYHFGTRGELDAQAREVYPEAFTDVVLTEIEPARTGAHTVIITCPVVGAKAHPAFCRALRALATRRGADLLALPVADPASRATPNGVGRIDRLILDLGFQVVTEDLVLNDNLEIFAIHQSAKHILPVNGLERYGARGRSLIIPSPKRFLKFVPTLGPMPHALMTPGSCTVPNYETDRHRSLRTARLADQDHILAAIIVEIEDDQRFHFRQLTWSEDAQNVIDMGETQDGDLYGFEAVHMGDWHSWYTHEANRSFAFDNRLSASTIILHDSFDGAAVNHHERPLEHYARPIPLADELFKWADDVNRLAGIYKKVLIVRSNHDDRLELWLRERKHLKDRINYNLARTLEGFLLGGENPLAAYYGAECTARGWDYGGVEFLSPDVSYKIGGVEISQHGHKGSNGARGSIAGFEKALGPCNLGHAHTPQIYREAWQAGTSTPLRMDYTQGASSWSWSHIGIYPDGRRQMINLIP